MPVRPDTSVKQPAIKPQPNPHTQHSDTPQSNLSNPQQSSTQHSTPHLRLIPPIKFYRATQDEWADPEVDIPNLAVELSENLKAYTVSRRDPNSDNIAIPDLPNGLRVMLDYYRQQAAPVQPSLQSTFLASVLLGLPVLEASQDIQALGKLIKQFQSHIKLDHPLEMYMDQFLRQGVFVETEVGARYNLAIQPTNKDRIVALSLSSGVSYSSIALIASYSCLIEQPNMPQSRRNEWERKRETMYLGVSTKLEMAKYLLERLRQYVYQES